MIIDGLYMSVFGLLVVFLVLIVLLFVVLSLNFFDERFSSDIVFKEFRKGGLSISKINKKINHLAASYILQGFLDTSKNMI